MLDTSSTRERSPSPGYSGMPWPAIQQVMAGAFSAGRSFDCASQHPAWMEASLLGAGATTGQQPSSCERAWFLAMHRPPTRERRAERAAHPREWRVGLPRGGPSSCTQSVPRGAPARNPACQEADSPGERQRASPRWLVSGHSHKRAPASIRWPNGSPRYSVPRPITRDEKLPGKPTIPTGMVENARVPGGGGGGRRGRGSPDSGVPCAPLPRQFGVVDREVSKANMKPPSGNAPTWRLALVDLALQRRM